MTSKPVAYPHHRYAIYVRKHARNRISERLVQSTDSEALAFQQGQTLAWQNRGAEIIVRDRALSGMGLTPRHHAMRLWTFIIKGHGDEARIVKEGQPVQYTKWADARRYNPETQQWELVDVE